MKQRKRSLTALVALVFMLTCVSPVLAEGTMPFTILPAADANKTTSEILRLLGCSDGWISTKHDSQEPVADDAPVATGMVVHAGQETRTLVLRGDVLGTGRIQISQLARMAQACSGGRPLEGAYLAAADLNADGSLDIADLTAAAALLQSDPGVIHVSAVDPAPLLDSREHNPQAQTAARGANAFAFRFSRQLLKESSDQTGNFVCSPYSVWLPLAALVNATDASSREELLDTLGAAGLTPQDINEAASRMLYDLTDVQGNEWKVEAGFDAHDPLKIANAVFVDMSKKIRPEFAQTFADSYRGASIGVDFASGQATDAVNQWASEATDGVIDKIIERFDPDTVAAIANAIYFSDRWQSEFDPELTTEDVFHSPHEDMRAQFMQREATDIPYFEDESVQSAALEFGNGGGLAILLPKDGDAAGLLGSLTEDRFREIRDGMHESTGRLRLPRFEVESDVLKLNDCLKALGVPLLDDISTPITGLLEGDALFISEAVQKTSIQVDEKGTTAAAVTVMGMAEGAVPEQGTPFDMNCSSPFVFVLYGDTRDGGSQVLFTGMINQPASVA